MVPGLLEEQYLVIIWTKYFPLCIIYQSNMCLMICQWYFIALLSQLKKTPNWSLLTLAPFCTVFRVVIYKMRSWVVIAQFHTLSLWFTLLLWAAFIWWHWLVELNVKQFTTLRIFLVQVRLRVEVLFTPRSTLRGFELMTSRWWEYHTCHWNNVLSTLSTVILFPF